MKFVTVPYYNSVLESEQVISINVDHIIYVIPARDPSKCSIGFVDGSYLDISKTRAEFMSLIEPNKSEYTYNTKYEG